MYIHLKIIGVLLMALALIHVIFPKYFNWKEEQSHLSLINKQMMNSHTFFVAFTVFLMGFLCFTSSSEIIETQLGNRLALGLGIFWMIRLIFQLFIYSPKLWRGKVFETIVHVIFTFFWGYMVYVFLSVYFNS
ncbi:hypothetical protein [Urechidicola croceus]|uniref:Uncharacterized protein n=1 Tax=Urechidicola croceus TaxID=1850246 RepID=A0A1D8P7J9_9FLAO|nr:hypothetical protein [Urechidicola croceus]AOW20540.1 hypothetical protein LPB138_07550 [Urechidicola croceus]